MNQQRQGRRVLPRLAPALLPLLLLVTGCAGSCGGIEDKGFAVKAGTQAPEAVHLFDRLPDADLGGVAKALVESPPDAAPEVLLDLGFEDGALGSLTPFGGVGVATESPAKKITVEPCDRGEGANACVKIEGGLDHGMSLRTAPIPISPSETYRLSYAVRGQAVATGKDVLYGGASVILYDISSGDDPTAVLADEGKERRARLPKPPPSFWMPSHYGASPWTLDEDVFTPPAGATHMVISFDLNRPKDDREAHKSRGVIFYDDIRLVRTREPMQRRYAIPGQGGGEPHPLKVALSRKFGDVRNDVDSRYGIYAPAPSTLTWSVTIPEKGRLSFGTSLLAEAEAKDGPDVTFKVLVDDGAGAKAVHTSSMDAGDAEGWKDFDVDLTAYAGKAVKLTLATEGPTQGAGPFTLPDATAVFGYPILHSGAAPGKVLVLVAFDTLTSKRSSTYGYPVQTMPQLTRIAKEGVRFDRALSPSAWTLAGFSSMLTGMDPAHTGAGERQYGEQAWRRPLASPFLTIAERLRLAGFETRAWINNPYLTDEFGLHEGFSHFVDINTRSRTEASAPAQEDILRALEQPVGYDRFFFIHYMDPHGPYRPNKTWKARFTEGVSYGGRFKDEVDGWDFLDLTQGKLKIEAEDKAFLTHLYEALIGYVDGLLGDVYNRAKAVSAPDRFAFMVTADHGEELWEHDLFEHGHTMYGELLEVPLVVVAPGHQERGLVVKGAVSAHDVAPTLMTLAGLDVPAVMDAQSLVPYLKGDDTPPADRPLYGHQMLYGTQRLSLEQAGVKFLYNEDNTDPSEARSPKPKVRYELYDIKADPGEQTNLADTRSADVSRMMEPLAKGFVRSLRGHYVVYLEDAGDKAHTLEGKLTLGEGGFWLRFTDDLIWPLPNGKAGPVDFRLGRSGGESVQSFKVRAPRALLAFSLDKGQAPVRLELTLDGEAVDPGQIQYGTGALKPESGDAALSAEALTLAHTALFKGAATSEGPRIVFAYIPEMKALEGTQGATISDDTAEQLRELGYIDGE